MTEPQVDEIRTLLLKRSPRIANMYALSPFVWREGPVYKLLLRIVPREADPAKKIARIHYGESTDGLTFNVEDEPLISGEESGEDRDGCEDPTVAMVDGKYYIYYTGWNEAQKRGQLMLAAGTDLRHLQKCGVALPWSSDFQNPKEATLARASDGTWRLFFEFAAGDASKIGVAASPGAGGPWTILEPLWHARPDRWDAWHLSTGPIVDDDSGNPMMFYNGATADAKWRIGWIRFDTSYSRVVARSNDPMITPPSPRTRGATDIAFAASAIELPDGINLYYSVSDEDLYRATLRLGTGNA